MYFKSLHSKIIFSSLFAISMAYLESAVVVYLRELFYPNGFQFPLVEIPFKLLAIEIGREVATILMLYAYAKSVSRNSREVFAYFSLTFGIWDIWYYIWLKLLLDWPATMLDWDILFLIPLPWVGPVIAPILVSLALICSAYIILRFENKNKPLILTNIDWILEILSGILIILSFLTPFDEQKSLQQPDYFSWWIFLSGFLLGIAVFVRRIVMHSRIVERN
jgi:hypothetical protein